MTTDVSSIGTKFENFVQAGCRDHGSNHDCLYCQKPIILPKLVIFFGTFLELPVLPPIICDKADTLNNSFLLLINLKGLFSYICTIFNLKYTNKSGCNNHFTFYLTWSMYFLNTPRGGGRSIKFKG